MSTLPCTNLSPAEKSSLANEIVERLHLLAETLVDERSDRAWTAQIKGMFAQLAERRGFHYRPYKEAGQWLFDFIWFREDENNLFTELTLALESEWSLHFEDILYDFEKLLIAKAPLKVMIFQDGKDELEEVWQKLQSNISTFATKVPGETYLLAAFINSTRTFQLKLVYDASVSCILVDAPPPSRSSLRTRENAA